jgi:Peptidase family M28
MRKYKTFLRSFLIITAMILLVSCGEKQNQTVLKPLFELSSNSDIPKFDAGIAYDQVKAQVDFGPRNPGSRGHEEELLYLQSELNKYADKVEVQEFNYSGYDNAQLKLSNVIAKYNPSAKNRIFLCAHWDTRPRSDHDPDKAKRNLPILGANDGASGVGILLELAKILKNQKVNYGVDLVFFDGEDYGKESDLDNFCLGSKYYAANYKDPNLPAFGILLDLVGDKEASFAEEGNSLRYARDVVNIVWGIASQINANMFKPTEGETIYDDHIPLNQAGLKTIDIIDAGLVGADTPVKRRNYWHTQGDNMENIGKNALQQVGDVMTHLIYSLKFNY